MDLAFYEKDVKVSQFSSFLLNGNAGFTRTRAVCSAHHFLLQANHIVVALNLAVYRVIILCYFRTTRP